MWLCDTRLLLMQENSGVARIWNELGAQNYMEIVCREIVQWTNVFVEPQPHKVAVRLCSSKVNWKKFNCWKSREHVPRYPVAGDDNAGQELIRRRDSESELFLRPHRTRRGQRLRPLNRLPNFYHDKVSMLIYASNHLCTYARQTELSEFVLSK